MMMYKIRVRATTTTNIPSCKEMINSKPGVIFTFVSIAFTPIDFLVKATGTTEAKDFAIKEAERLFPEKKNFLTAQCIEVFNNEEEAWQYLS